MSKGFNNFGEAFKGKYTNPNLDSGRNSGAYNQTPKLPEGYLDGGYFEDMNGKKYIKKEYLLNYAEQVAHAIENGYNQERGMQFSNGQIRKYFDKCRDIETKLANNNYNFRAIEGDISRLIPMIKNANGKGNVPHILVDFIEKNVNCLKDQNDFSKGFLLHFEAVIANLRYNNPKR